MADAHCAVAGGADMLGFNFYRGSKRYVDPILAREIVNTLAVVQIVGVFVNAEVSEIAEIVNTVPLDAVQLHGDETSCLIGDLRRRLPDVEIIKAIRVDTSFAPAALESRVADRILLDGDAGPAFGGAGATFDWTLARGLNDIILAGGLTVENVGDAVRTVQPYAVDVASGVESSPGKKDPEKVAAFIKAAKGA